MRVILATNKFDLVDSVLFFLIGDVGAFLKSNGASFCSVSYIRAESSLIIQTVVNEYGLHINKMWYLVNELEYILLLYMWVPNLDP